MGSTPSQVNQPAQTVNEIIHALIFDVAIMAAETAAIAEFPVLGLPIIRFLFHRFLLYMAGKLDDKLSKMATISIIDIQTLKEKTAYQLAEGKLRAARLLGDSNAIKQATDEFRVAIGNLVKWDGITR